MALADTLTRAIAAKKRALLKGGILQPVEWLRRTGPRDERGRQAVTSTLLDVFIEDKPALDRDRIATDRNDNTVLTILDPLAITDEDMFRWGDPPDTYSVKSIDGLLQDEDTGVRFSSEVTVIR